MLAGSEIICPHIHLPLQSGDDGVLRRMNRPYSAKSFRHLILNLANSVLDLAIGVDVIVGFPGEKEEQFEHTFSLLKEMKFDVVHIAAYSPRPGTIAWQEYEDDVPSEVKKERLNKVEALPAVLALNDLLCQENLIIVLTHSFFTSHGP